MNLSIHVYCTSGNPVTRNHEHTLKTQRTRYIN